MKGKDGSSKTVAQTEAKAAPAQENKPAPPPPPPPKPTCRLVKGFAPTKAGAEPFDVAVAVSCEGGKVPLSGHSVTFTFKWDGKSSTQTVTVPTDASGVAPLVMRVSNDETRVEKVRDVAERSHDELDHFDPDKKDPGEPAEPQAEESAPAQLLGGRDTGLITASDSVTIAKTATATTAAVKAEEAVAVAMEAARASRIASAVRTGDVFTLSGRGTALRVTATLTLSGTAATAVGAAVVVVMAKQAFDIGWAIGSVAEREISDVQRGLKQYDKDEKDCLEKISDYEITQKGLDPHAIKYEELGKGAEIKLWELCRCKNGEIAVRFKGCKGPTRRTGIFL